VDGLTEETACSGDTYAVGEARIQVTGPRYPCWKIERRWGIAGLSARVAEAGRTGWYGRVLQEGLIAPELPIMLVERPYPQWTAALTNDVGHGRNTDVETAQALAACPLLDVWPALLPPHLTCQACSPTSSSVLWQLMIRQRLRASAASCASGPGSHPFLSGPRNPLHGTLFHRPRHPG
jgi:hypothetical protein